MRCTNLHSHCGAGCLSGCSGAPPTGNNLDPRGDGLCGKVILLKNHIYSELIPSQEYGGAICDPRGIFGGCCSSHG